MPSTKEIRKELAILIKKKINSPEYVSESKAVNDARQEINIKYGKGWREQDMFKPYPVSNNVYNNPSIYDDHVNGEYWMD